MRVNVLWLLSMWRLSRALRIQQATRVIGRANQGRRTIPPPLFIPPLATRCCNQCRLFATIDTNESQPQYVSLTYQDFTRLAAEIRRHDELYYNSQEIELSDDEYDALVEQEAQYCRAHPQDLLRYQQESGLGIQATRYGGRVGAIQAATTTPQAEALKRQRHVAPMLSLQNVHSTPQLLQWLERIRKQLFKFDGDASSNMDSITIVTEPKLDGLSLSLRYTKQHDDKCTLQWAATRGDGTEGQDVTQAVKSLHGIPQSISSKELPSILEVRGEVILPSTAFEALQTNFSNARNAASGILLRKAKDLNQKDRELQSQLRFYAYDVVVSNENESATVEDGIQMRTLLSNWGFDVPQPVQVTKLQVMNDTEWNETDVTSLLHYYHDLEQHRQGEKSELPWDDYEMDGVVHKLSNTTLRQMLGNTNRSPRWAVAHKFPAETALTSLLGLEVQVGRTGALTPVAILEPVDIAGVSVKRATLHNFGFVQQLMGGTSVPIGTKVLVRRAGDVIPQVVQRVNMESNDDDTVLDDADMVSLLAPEKCPACNSPTRVVETLANSTNNNNTQGQVIRCDGPSLLCPPRAVGALAHAFSRGALDVTGLSEARIQQLLDAGLLKIPADLFLLASSGDASKELLSNITELPGWGEKSANNLAKVASNVASKGVSLSRFIYSLGIRHAGLHTSKLIASAYGSADTFLMAVEEASTASDNETAFASLAGSNETEGVKGIGPAQISSLRTFAKEIESVHAARKLANAIPVHDEVIAVGLTEPSDSKPWEGFTVVFTGSLPNGLSRREAQELARQMGAKSTPASVSKSTDVVVAGEKGGKKLDKAVELGVRVVDGDEFVELVEANIPAEDKPNA